MLNFEVIMYSQLYKYLWLREFCFKTKSSAIYNGTTNSKFGVKYKDLRAGEI